MAVYLKFTDDSDSPRGINLVPTLEVICSNLEFITLRIRYSEVDTDFEERTISINKRSAIKLAKELRKQISFLED